MQEMEQSTHRGIRSRVQETDHRPSVQELTAAAMQRAGVYRQLSRQAFEPAKGLLEQLCIQELRHSRCLKGVHLAATGHGLSAQTEPPAFERAQTALRRCYATALQAAGHYAKRSDERDFGHVFALLARQEQESCTAILEVMALLHR